jgi:4-hydroxybenzoate polyprenyltransferase
VSTVERANPVSSFLRLVVIEHSVFALPFAFISALTAMNIDGGTMQWGTLLLITFAMVGARTFAMAANRIIDREIDARNPRTAQRELVTGAVSLRTAYVGAAVALLVLLASAAALNTLCLVLAPFAVAPLILYPYAKRFTNYPHAILGVAQAVAPVGAWVAVTGSFTSPPSWPAICLGLAVGTWIGGFDLIYASQDVDSDRRNGVKSTPARHGIARSLVIARWAHVATFAFLIAFGLGVDAGFWWWLGVVLTAAAIVYEHTLVKPDDLSRVNRAFFTVNGFVGIGLFVFATIDLVADGLTF